MEMGAFEDLTYWVMYNACELDLYGEICVILPDGCFGKGTVADTILNLQVCHSHSNQG